MTNRKTAGALLSSAIALVLCCAMLVGTTFAWFTDSASTAVNQIEAGTLKVDIVKPDGKTSLAGGTLAFVDKDENKLWEPGCTYELEPFCILNKGNLALKYEIHITGLEGDAELLEAIEWTVSVGGQETSLDQLTGSLAANAVSKSIVITGHMKEEAGNQYQGKTIEGIAITVRAAQDTVEHDSQDNQYDKDASFTTVVTDPASLAAAQEIGGNVELAASMTLTDDHFLSILSAANPYTINGNGNTITGVVTNVDAFQWSGNTPDMSTIFSSEGKTGALATVNDITFTGTMSAIMAGEYINTSSNWFNTEFNNVKIVNAEVISFSGGISPALCVYGNMTMNNCTVTGTTLSALDTDPMWPVYDVAVVNYSNTVINNSQIDSLYMWNQAKVTVAEGSEVGTIVIRGNMNATKYGLVVEAGATVNAIDLSNIADTEKVNITIADGATVGAFVDNGVKYTTLDAWKAAQ